VTTVADKAFELDTGILSVFAIDARGARFSELLKITDSSHLGNVGHLLTSRAWELASH